MSRYDKIVREYIVDLKTAHVEVMAWWNKLMIAASPEGDMGAAEQVVRPRWPAGPVSHPRILAVYRKHYLRIEEMNRAWHEERESRSQSNRRPSSGWGEQPQDDDGIIEPRFLLIDNLDSPEPELFEFMNHLVFNPIGFDYEGEVV